jgi:hypothetical protein
MLNCARSSLAVADARSPQLTATRLARSCNREVPFHAMVEGGIYFPTMKANFAGY